MTPDGPPAGLLAARLSSADPDVRVSAHAEAASDERSLTFVRRLRSRPGGAVPPDLEYRCGEGCLLLACYSTPAGIVAYHPSYRASKEYLQSTEILLAETLGPVTAGRPKLANATAWAIPEHAHLLDPEAVTVLTQCRHVLGTADTTEVRAEVARALKAGKTVRARLPPPVS